MKTIVFMLTFFLSFHSLSAEVVSEAPLDINDITCPNSKILGPKMVNDVCWSGMFPLYLANVKLKGRSKHAPADRNKDRLCACGGDLEKGKLPTVGTSLGLYLPKFLITVTKNSTHSLAELLPTLFIKYLVSFFGLTVTDDPLPIISPSQFSSNHAQLDPSPRYPSDIDNKVDSPEHIALVPIILVGFIED